MCSALGLRGLILGQHSETKSVLPYGWVHLDLARSLSKAINLDNVRLCLNRHNLYKIIPRGVNFIKFSEERIIENHNELELPGVKEALYLELLQQFFLNRMQQARCQ